MRDAKRARSTRGYATFNVGYALLNLGQCAEALPFLARSLKLAAARRTRCTSRSGSRRRRAARKVEHPRQRSPARRAPARILLERREEREREVGRQLRAPLARVGRRLDEVREAELGRGSRPVNGGSPTRHSYSTQPSA